jgi:hypothetical protein
VNTPTPVDLADVLKAKGKYTDLRVGGSLAMSFKSEFTVEELAFPQKNGNFVVIAMRGKRKMLSLGAVLRRDGGLIMEGWNLPVFLDTDSRTRYTGSGTINLWSKSEPATLEVAEKIISTIASKLVFNNLRADLPWRLYQPDLESYIAIPPEFMAALPRHTLAGPPAPPRAPRKCPLTDNELDQLKAAWVEAQTIDGRRFELSEGSPEDEALAEELRTRKPLFKLFTPAGASTWLCYNMEPDGDTINCVADLGQDCVESGTVSLLNEIQNGEHRMPVEKDRHFEGKKVTRTADELCELKSLSGNIYG